MEKEGRDLTAEEQVRDFYDREGWNVAQGVTTDSVLWEDLRGCAAKYVTATRRKILRHLPPSGRFILDAGSGPVQHSEYLEYSKGYEKRYCVDISQEALKQARETLGSHGEYVCSSILELPFPDDYFDSVVSLHTIYHIDKDQQEAAVRQLIRVAKPQSPIVIVYANPDRLLARLKRLVSRAGPSKPGLLYYHPHPLQWWTRFKDSCEVRLLPWRSLTVEDARRLVPDNALGSTMLGALLRFENAFPKLATKLGAYPIVVLTKRR